MAFARVKVFGERNTSTNALSQLLAQNSGAALLPAQVDELGPVTRLSTTLFRKLVKDQTKRERWIDAAFRRRGPQQAWKHAATVFDDLAAFQDSLVICCVRHPLSWLRALHRRPYQHVGPSPADFGAFLTAPWPTAERERLGCAVHTPPTLYNAKLQSYRQFQEAMAARGQAVEIVKFEDFAVDQIAVFQALAPKLQGAVPDPKPILKSTKDAGKDANYYKNYYGNNLWLDDLPPDAVTAANALIDWEAAGAFCYVPLTPGKAAS